jgi:5'(3')-deoxyribonucleotidase
MSKILYLDLDGVLADFDEHASHLIAKSGKKIVTDSDFYDVITEDEHFFFNLKPTPYAFKLWEAAHKVSDNIQILTALPSGQAFKNVMVDKRRWVAKHFSRTIKVNFGPFSHDKWKHAKRGDILVDDKKSNIEEWRRLGGGIGILHYNYETTINKLMSLA